jgi:serine/arginine repetitive matrix protein 2
MQPQRVPPAVSANASLAATKAFIRDRESNGDLSSAAAAAALRTHVTTPTPVGDTVTKRMVRRGSLSSNGSSSRPVPAPLHRQSSSGSMTERSFRSPSPGRGAPAEHAAPPVPPVPQHIQKGGVVHRRASSLEPVYRGGSPGSRGGGRGVSLDRGVNTAGRGQRPTSHLAQVSEEEDSATRSVNFSRPMSPGAIGTGQPSSPTSHGWFGGPVVNQEAVQRMSSTSRPKTASGVSAYDLQNAQWSVQSASERPVRTHQVSRGVEGTRFSSGSMRAKPSGTAVPSGPVDPKSPDAIYDPSTRTFIHKQAAMARHRELHEEPEQPSQQYVAQHVDDYRPHQVSSPPRQRSPSPVRQYVQYEESPTPQRRAEPLLPRVDTVGRRNDPVAQPIGATQQRRSSEDFADADIQAPEQANTGRKLDDASSTGAEFTENIDSPKYRANQDSSYPYLAAPVTGAGGSHRDAHDRHASLSPPRNAHFAPVAVELAGSKHEPLPRSSSPAKSALKSSPSVSRRGHSPVSGNGRLLSKNASSEASDATSDEGSKKQKRNVRVSFDEAPVVAGTAASGDVGTPVTPQGLSKSKWSPIAEKDNEFEDFMKPRPALPLFGSIRDKERRSNHEDIPEKVTETVTTTPMSASVGSIGDHTHASSDHGLGSIVAQDFAQKSRAANDPLPPEVTTVEGSGYVSDSSDESGPQKHGDATERWQESSALEPKSLTSQVDDKLTTPAPSVERTVEVPQISLFPATPSPAERPEPKFQSMMIPGGWGDEVQDPQHDIASTTESTPKVTWTGPVPESIQQQHGQPQSEPNVHGDEDDLTDDDTSSVYSDAYEDLSDTEGGFASIDALMESPVTSSPSGLLFSKYADKSITESPTSKLRNKTAANDFEDGDITPTQDWSAAQQHWSGFNTARKNSEPERAAHAESVIARVMQAPTVPEQPRPERASGRKAAVEPVPRASPSTPLQQASTKPLKSALKKAPQPTSTAEPQMRTSMRGPPPRQGPASETHMKKTMRAGPNNATRAEPGMRSSMRTGPEATSRAQPQMRMSMRANDAASSTGMGLAASRHSMVPVETKPPRGALQKRHIPAAPSAPKARPQSMPAPKQAAPVPTYDSDSDASASSFQRSRGRGGRGQGGRYTMRGSMRQEPAPTMRATAPALKQVRSISPPGSPSPALRKSMRPSSPTPEVVKSSRFSIRSLSPMGRFRSSKGPDVRPSSPIQPKQMPAFSKQPKPQKQKAPVAERTKAPFSSRFADSSDDEDDQPRRFQSRFADSDDDEPIDYKLPPGLAPVRGIPKKAGEGDGDSTDLEEEAEEESSKLPSAAATAGPTNGVNKSHVNGNANGQGAALASGSLRDSKHAPALPSFEAGKKSKAKRGFFGLGKKKTVTSPTEPVESSPAAQDEIPLPPVQRNRELGLPLTPIDEDKDFGTPVESSPVSKKSPKLQRRSTPEWPLPAPPAIGTDDRPMSSDGIAPRRPRFQNRQSSQISNVTAPDASGRSVSYGRSGKKKKFQGLRRVFGLND